MAARNQTTASKIVSVATILAVLLPSIWLLLMTFPDASATLFAAPKRNDLDPVAFWAAFSTSITISIALIASLTFLSIAALLGKVTSDRPLFLALNAIWAYIGVIAILGKTPGLALPFRTTFTASNIGWFGVVATGLPIWGPLLLWFFGTANTRSQRPT